MMENLIFGLVSCLRNISRESLFSIILFSPPESCNISLKYTINMTRLPKIKVLSLLQYPNTAMFP